MNCIKKVESTIEAHALIDSGSRILAAVSGGPDSTALLSILSHLSSKMDFELAAAHLDHRIRPESERERAAVERFASSLGIQVFVGSMDIPRKARSGRLGLEEAARPEEAEGAALEDGREDGGVVGGVDARCFSSQGLTFGCSCVAKLSRMEWRSSPGSTGPVRPWRP